MLIASAPVPLYALLPLMARLFTPHLLFLRQHRLQPVADVVLPVLRSGVLRDFGFLVAAPPTQDPRQPLPASSAGACSWDASHSCPRSMACF